MQASVEQTSSKQAAPVAIFKLIIIGDHEVGKSTLIRKFSTGILEELVINNQKVTVHKTLFPTNIGDIQFNVWDIDAGKGDSEPPEEFIMGADCAIFLFDVTWRVTYKNIVTWFKKVQSVHQSKMIPTALVANKVDSKDRRIKSRHVIFHRKKNIPYSEISAKANYNIEEPFIHLARVLTKETDLSLVKSPIVQPPSIVMDPSQIEELETQKKEANLIPFIDDEDDDDY